ncbi:MAG: TrmH family RNA methyltransferase [Planctomycetota bacterium]|jgi:tRNA G18 (ribose-2'-O)-methylase SpoU
MSRPPNVIHVNDIDDPRLADYRQIRDRELRERNQLGSLFIGEQPLVVERMLQTPGVTKSVLLSTTWVGRLAPHAAPPVPVYVAALPVMRLVAGFNIHRGVLAVGYRAAVERAGLDDLITEDERPLTLLLCQEIANIDNIGFLFRNAAAFGVDGVVLSPRCHDPLYRKSLRVSIGHALTVPFVRSTDWAGDLAQLKRHGFTLIAAATAPTAVDIEAIPQPHRVALIVGHEFHGLPTATLDQCDHVVKVLMAPGVDSLNVAVAAAVCLNRLSTGQRT